VGRPGHQTVEIGFQGGDGAQHGIHGLVMAFFHLFRHLREQALGFRREQGDALEIDDLEGAIDLVQVGGGGLEGGDVLAVPIRQGRAGGIQGVIQFTLDPGERTQVEIHFHTHGMPSYSRFTA
jgi:hypothetical protein